MSILSKFRELFERKVIVRAGYRSADTFSPDRSWLPEFVQDADQDISPAARQEMTRKARYFEKNSAIAQKILDLIEVNTVGNGIIPTPTSSDIAWNEKASEAFTRWTTFADASSRDSFYTLQSLIVRAKAVDGEIFIIKQISESGWPRLQLVESHRVRSWKKPPSGLTDIDGVWVDENGRPQFIVIHGSGRPTILEADRVIHVFSRSRAGQHRGLTLFHAVLHTLHDLDDLQRYEMVAAKDGSSRANIIYTESGEIPNTSPIGAGIRKGITVDGVEDKQKAYEKAFGGKTVALKRGDKWEQSQALRPSPAMREFWLYLTDLVCKGTGISYAAVNDYQGNYGGTALRGAVASDNRFFDVCSKDLTFFNNEVWRFVIPLLVQQGEIGALPDGWDKVRWQTPRRATVDIGRDSRALLEELARGVRNYRDVMGEVGIDWREGLRQRIAEQKFIRDEAIAQGLDAGLVLGLLGAGSTSTTFAEKAATAIDGDQATQPKDSP